MLLLARKLAEGGTYHADAALGAMRDAKYPISLNLGERKFNGNTTLRSNLAGDI